MKSCALFSFYLDAVPVSTILTTELPTLKAKIAEESLKSPEKSNEEYKAEVANLKLYIKQLEDKQAKHAEELSKKDILVEHAQKHNTSLRGENERLKRLIRKRNKQLEKIRVAKVTKEKQDEIVTKVLKPHFTEAKISCFLRLDWKRCNEWSHDDYTIAITLHCISPKAYKFIRKSKMIPLPGKVTYHLIHVLQNLGKAVVFPVLPLMAPLPNMFISTY